MDALHRYRRHYWALGQAFLLSVLLQVLIMVTYYLIGVGLNLGVPLVYFFVFIPLTTVVAMLPVSVAGLGVREAGVIYFFAKVGVGAGAALGMSLVCFSLTLIVSTWGVWCFSSTATPQSRPRIEPEYFTPLRPLRALRSNVEVAGNPMDLAGTFHAADRWAFLLVNRTLQNPAFDFLMPIFSDKRAGLLLVAVVTPILFARCGRRVWPTIAVAVLAVALSDLGATFLKDLFQRTRPCHVIADVHLLTGCTASFSIPSGHASNMFALAGAAWTVKSRWRWAVASLAVGVAYSRVDPARTTPGMSSSERSGAGPSGGHSCGGRSRSFLLDVSLGRTRRRSSDRLHPISPKLHRKHVSGQYDTRGHQGLPERRPTPIPGMGTRRPRPRHGAPLWAGQPGVRGSRHRRG